MQDLNELTDDVLDFQKKALRRANVLSELAEGLSQDEYEMDIGLYDMKGERHNTEYLANKWKDLDRRTSRINELAYQQSEDTINQIQDQFSSLGDADWALDEADRALDDFNAVSDRLTDLVHDYYEALETVSMAESYLNQVLEEEGRDFRFETVTEARDKLEE